MLEVVRIGVIGTGWWAETMYSPSIESHPFARITAISGGKAERSADSYDGPAERASLTITARW